VGLGTHIRDVVNHVLYEDLDNIVLVGFSYGGFVVTGRGAIVAAEIFEGSPAAKAGVAANDIISHIDGEPVSGLTVQQAVEKIRGQEGTKALLRISRKGSDPIELSVAREIIKMKSVEGASK
jgi:carboxyl-terminal processing protease